MSATTPGRVPLRHAWGRHMGRADGKTRNVRPHRQVIWYYFAKILKKLPKLRKKVVFLQKYLVNVVVYRPRRLGFAAFGDDDTPGQSRANIHSRHVCHMRKSTSVTTDTSAMATFAYT